MKTGNSIEIGVITAQWVESIALICAKSIVLKLTG